MAKKKPAQKQRPDAERRLRQAARLADHLRLLQLLLGRGRWDYKTLADELECSERTIRRRLFGGTSSSWADGQRRAGCHRHIDRKRPTLGTLPPANVDFLFPQEASQRLLVERDVIVPLTCLVCGNAQKHMPWLIVAWQMGNLPSPCYAFTINNSNQFKHVRLVFGRRKHDLADERGPWYVLGRRVGKREATNRRSSQGYRVASCWRQQTVQCCSLIATTAQHDPGFVVRTVGI